MNINLEVFADVLVYDCDKQLVVMQYGGYPEMVQAMLDSISIGSADVKVFQPRMPEYTLKGDRNGEYTRNIIRSSLYSIRFISRKDDMICTLKLDDPNEEKTKRKLYLYCEGEDKEEDELFRQLDHKLMVPLIPEFKEYFISELKKRKILTPMQVYSPEMPFRGLRLEVSNDEHEVTEILDIGIRNDWTRIP